ncbi:MAG: AEC family transporter [Oscillospiraceae bacterium]|nr:AEC family transporter [Oscillospiraceae bacterium]
MLQNTFLVARQAAILFVLMGAGGLAAKAGWLSRDGAKQMTNIVFYFATPCVIIDSFLTADFTPELVGGMARTAVFAVIAHIAGILISLPVFRREQAERKSVYRMALTFSNCGFMGIPLARGVLGTECVVYISVYIAVFNLFAWTYGVSLFRPGKKLSVRSIFLNPGTTSLLVGLAVAALRFDPPDLVSEPIRLLSALNSPVAMMVLGYYLFTTSLRPQRGEGGMWAAVAVKLLVIPAAALAVSYALGLSGLWLAAALILAAAPSATNVLLFAARFDGNTALAARAVSYCTLLSMVTMPVLLGVALAINPV